MQWLSFANENVAKHQIRLCSKQIHFEGHRFYTMLYNRVWVSDIWWNVSKARLDQDKAFLFKSASESSFVWSRSVSGRQQCTQSRFLPVTNVQYNHVIWSTLGYHRTIFTAYVYSEIMPYSMLYPLISMYIITLISPLNTRQLNPLNAELNPIRHLLVLVGPRHIVHVSRKRVKR